MLIRRNLFSKMFVSLEKSVAVYELLHAHARGETCLTEDQLGNVVTGVAMEARDVIDEAEGAAGAVPVRRLVGWVDAAQVRALRHGA